MKSVVMESMQAQLPVASLPSARLLLSGAVGSTLNGIDRETSDIDRMAIYAYSMETVVRSLIGVSNTKDSFFNSDPDVFGYDVGRITELLMKSNAPVLNFLHSDSFEFSTPLGLEIAEITKERLLTLDGLLRVIPASAMASYKESVFNADRDAIDYNTKISDAPKNVARKLKVAFVQISQAKQALNLGFYRTQVPNPEFFLNDYPDMSYANAIEHFEAEHKALKNRPTDDLNFKTMYNDEDVEVMRDWVVRARSFSI